VSGTERASWLMSLILGVLYLVTLPFQPYPGSVAVKGLSIATLAVVSWLGGARLLSAGLAASSIGDVLLDANPDTLFVPGLGAFLIAHLLYAIVFLRRRSWIPSLSRLVPAAAVVVYAVAFAGWLAPALGPLLIPVALYICVITGMVVSSMIASVPRFVPVGALLFLVSDSVLAAVRFKTAVTFGNFLIWGTYYAAQFLIAYGILDTVRRRE